MNITQLDIDKYSTYVKNHTRLVKLIGILAFKADYSNHDFDKQHAEGNYLNTLSMRNHIFNYKEQPSKSEQRAIDKAVGHHVKVNQHHPEYWDDSITEDNYSEEKPPVCHAEKMTKEALEEMCCDWAAVAIKFNQPLDYWFNKTVDSRFKFTNEQKQLIKNNMKRIEKVVKEHHVKFPGREEYSAKINHFKEENSENKTAALMFGRMNPFTVGHLKACAKLNSIPADARYVMLTHTQDKINKKNPLKCKNPLPYDIKFMYASFFLKESSYNNIELLRSDARTIIAALHQLYEAGFKTIIMVAGADRVDEFRSLLYKYNGVASNTGEIAYNFDNIEIVCAGERDSDSPDIAASASASKARQAAVNGSYEEFRKLIPTTNEEVAQDLYADVRKYMGVQKDDQ